MLFVRGDGVILVSSALVPVDITRESWLGLSPITVLSLVAGIPSLNSQSTHIQEPPRVERWKSILKHAHERARHQNEYRTGTAFWCQKKYR